MVCVSNRRRLDSLFNRLSWCRWKKTSKLRVTGLCEGNSPFPAQRTRNAENVSIWWRHHAVPVPYTYRTNLGLYCTYRWSNDAGPQIQYRSQSDIFSTWFLHQSISNMFSVTRHDSKWPIRPRGTLSICIKLTRMVATTEPLEQTRSTYRRNCCRRSRYTLIKS